VHIRKRVNRRGSKGSAGRQLGTARRIPTKRPRKLVESGNGEEQKRTMEERKQQHERVKDRTQIR
jgi:hypothetical protein